MANFEIIEQPCNLDKQLYLHQLASVYNMERLERDKFVTYDGDRIETDIGINADMAGYGKTISMVCLILRDSMPWDLNSEHAVKSFNTCGNGHIKIQSEIYFPKISTTLILAATSLIHQWVDELSHTNLNFATITTRKAALYVEPSEYDVLVVSPKMFNLLLSRFTDMAWKRFIYDEPTTVKIPSMSKIVAGFIWLVSATPQDLYVVHRSSRKNYISSIIGDRIFEYQVRNAITIKNDDNFVRQSFQMPTTKTIYYECQDIIYRAVNGLVDLKIIKMIEAGCISDAVQALGGKNTDNIIELLKKNKTIELEEIKSKIIIWGLRGNEEKKIEWQNREKSLLNQIGELEKRFENILSQNCSICYDKVSKPIMEPYCHNIFCGNCLLMWLKDKTTCPLCRNTINKNELVYITLPEEDKKETDIKETLGMTKKQTILNIINNSEKDSRIIIFSDWNATFDIIRDILNSNNIPFIEIKGTTETKTKKLEAFRSGEIKVLFLNSKIDSTGINLQNTTDIILFHKMEDGTKNQIIGRANRIGRTKQLTVHQLLSN